MTRTGQQRLRITALALGTMLVPAVIGTPSARAQTYTVLNRFRGADGANPAAGLIADSAGNLYGTTTHGGASGFGVVFKLSKTVETGLYNFTRGADGGTPAAGLIRDAAGNLYGTTAIGGASNQGVVFKLDKTHMETVLYSFTGGADGAIPVAGLIRDAAGNLYGTTAAGGTSGYGVVFKLDTTGKETVLYSFTGGADGAAGGVEGSFFSAGLIQDPAGNLLGTANGGGFFFHGGVELCEASCGLVFMIKP